MSKTRGKPGAPEASKPTFEPHKRASKGTGARGAKKSPLTPLQGVLINNSGPFGHRLRSKKSTLMLPKRLSRRDA